MSEKVRYIIQFRGVSMRRYFGDLDGFGFEDKAIALQRAGNVIGICSRVVEVRTKIIKVFKPKGTIT